MFGDWDVSLAVGVEVLDTDHKFLMSLMKQLSEAVATGQSRDLVGSILTVLVEVAEGHFLREERLLERAGYPALANHRREHRHLIDSLQLIQQRYLDGKRALLDESTLQFFQDWLVGHIGATDGDYRSLLENFSFSPDDLRGTVLEVCPPPPRVEAQRPRI